MLSNTGPESSVLPAASGGGGAGLRPAGADTGQEFETRLPIGGEQVPGDGEALAVENPYTETEITSVALPSHEQLHAAIAAAREAARAWGETPAIERCELLHEVANRMRARTDELAELVTLEGGKPRIENADEVGWTAAAFDYYAEL